ncbi:MULTISPECIES: amidohydrolase family protein [Amycolatopsis]|uniref:amidohydrolase family protein n=1 Tax=Amycolatopsis TaxID=1813 RepID=UPI000B8B3BAC|nr:MULTISPECIES: amidohydrolase family protein [Amycolatopsis]OXM66234.1 amidohydrolase [Amycolatopsis sp. KNN50.9b]
MYTKDGERYFIVDAHIALWDARPDNQRNIHGKQFIDCFYDYHRNLSPESEVWPYEDYLYQGGARLMTDLFDDGYVDHAIFQPAHLGAFYERGFGQTEEAFALAQAHPDKLTYNHFWDPRFEQAGLDQLRRDAERFGLKGVKLYTAEWQGDSRGYKLDDPWSYRYLEAAQELGIRNIHAGLAVAIPFIHTRPRYFAQIIGELLYWLDENRIQFSSDYALWTPRWLVERFVDFQIPEDMTEYAPLTTAQKKKILGLNAAAMYDIPVPAELQLPREEPQAVAVA